jgi:polyhydroxybutyrate depolymerase
VNVDRFDRTGRRRAALVVALLVLAVTTAACNRDAASPSAAKAKGTTTTRASEGRAETDSAPAACTPERPATPGQSTATFAVGGTDRSYVLHVPPGYDGRTRVPLVFDFHGNGSSAAIQLLYSGLAPVADREGFVVVAPEGQGSPRHFTLLGATPTEADDADVTVALLDHLEEQLCLDPTRVYATGMSNGGALSSVLACRAPDRFAAVAAVAAFLYLPACEDADRAVPLAAFMGTADPIVPFAGGRVNCCGNPNIPGAEGTIASFARHAGCDGEPATSRLGTTVELRRWNGCDDGAAVDFYVVEGGGHTWPGSPIDLTSRGLGATTHDVDATTTIWAFFEEHRLPSS